jgi:voltage-gated potassium channel
MELRRRLTYALLALLAVIIVATCGYKFFGVDETGRHVGWIDALYMTVVTLTTVGYGEIVSTAHSPGLRVFNALILIFGIGLMLYVFSVSTAFVVEGELKNIFWRRKMQKRIAGFSGHIIVCGAGETGLPIVEELVRTGRQVVVVDHDPERLHRHKEVEGVGLIEGDATDEEVLDQAGLERASGVIAALPSDKDNLVVTVTVRQKQPTIRIVARNLEPKMGDKILRAGANAIVSPNLIGGMRLASEMIRPHVVSFLDLMLKEKSKTLRIEEVPVPYHSSWVGKELGQLDLQERFSLCCLALRCSTDETYRYNPHNSELVKGNSVLVVMGNVEDVQTARRAAAASHAVAGS